MSKENIWGLIEEHWALVKFDDNIYHYFEGDTIKKEITVSENYYHESELNEKTAENRTMILPKTKRGKIKKFNYTAIQSFSPFGTYFTFSTAQVIIANYTTQRTYYHNISDTKNIDLEELSMCHALPPQAVMDNIFYYCEAVILGNLPLRPEENDVLLLYAHCFIININLNYL